MAPRCLGFFRREKAKKPTVDTSEIPALKRRLDAMESDYFMILRFLVNHFEGMNNLVPCPDCLGKGHRTTVTSQYSVNDRCWTCDGVGIVTKIEHPQMYKPITRHV